MKDFIEGFKKGLKYFGENVNFLVNLFLFSLVYIFGIGMTSLFLKIFRKRLLDLVKSNKESYWKNFKQKENLESFYNQF